jgi:hypothetical protein
VARDKEAARLRGYAIAVIALLTAFVSWIAFRTLVLAVRGQFFPARYLRTDARISSTGAADIAGSSNPRTNCLLTCLSISDRRWWLDDAGRGCMCHLNWHYVAR